MHTTLCMYATAIFSIVQPTEQTRASTVPLVKQLLKGVFRKKPPARVWADIWDMKKVLGLLDSWGKPSVLNYTHLTLNSHDLGFRHSQEAIRSESVKDYSNGYADNRGLSYLPTGV